MHTFNLHAQRGRVAHSGAPVAFDDGIVRVVHSVPKRGEVWAYCRVSTEQQDDKRQELEILQYANRNALTVSRFVRCTVSSRKDEQERGLDVLKHAAESGEVGTIVFSELSRLGRSVGEIARLVSYFTEHGVKLVFLKENMTLGGSAAAAPDITSKVTLTIFSLLAEIERDLISERTKAGLAARKAAGVRLGRPMGRSKLDKHEAQIRAWTELGVTQRAMARHLQCTEATLSNWLARKRSPERAEEKLRKRREREGRTS